MRGAQCEAVGTKGQTDECVSRVEGRVLRNLHLIRRHGAVGRVLISSWPFSPLLAPLVCFLSSDVAGDVTPFTHREKSEGPGGH